jgi:diketogulonate reductase-like aldo/keto reductase
MPRLGLGTFKAKGNEVKKAVQWALQCGYRLIDTASIYKNEVEIGEAVRDANIKRHELFICSKVSPFEHGFEEATQAVNKILDRLGFTYLDLCLIHWPGAAKVDVKSRQNSKLRGETWHALEQLYKQGKCRAIGVSNYNEQHLTELLSSCEIKPMVNQVEVHPWFAQVNLRRMCALHDIVIQAYSPLGCGAVCYTCLKLRQEH